MRNAMRGKKDLEALGEYVYGKEWRTAVADEKQWDTLIEFAAAKQLRQVVEALEKVMGKQPAVPETMRLCSKGEAPSHPMWSEETNREVTSRCAIMFKDLFGQDGLQVGIRGGNEEAT